MRYTIQHHNGESISQADTMQKALDCAADALEDFDVETPAPQSAVIVDSAQWVAFPFTVCSRVFLGVTGQPLTEKEYKSIYKAFIKQVNPPPKP